MSILIGIISNYVNNIDYMWDTLNLIPPTFWINRSSLEAIAGIQSIVLFDFSLPKVFCKPA